MSEVTPTPGSNPPAGWYDDSASGKKRWFDGTIWTDHYQDAPAAAQQQPINVTVQAPVQTDTRKARDKAQYVRQQKGHSAILHWVFLGIFTIWILPIYYTVSPNHYWHA